MRRPKTLALYVAVLVAAPAQALESNLPPCKNADHLVIQETTPRVAHGRYATTDQNIYALGYSRSTCFKDLDGRWLIEGQLAAVDEEGRHARAANFGAGVQWPLLRQRDGWAVDAAPVLRLGYEHSPEGNARLVNLGVTFVASKALTRAADGLQDLVLVAAVKNDYTARNWGGALHQLGRTDQRATLALMALDKVLFMESTWRLRVSGAVERISGDFVGVPSIRTLSASIRRVFGLCDDYRWYAELATSQGSNGYRAVLLSVTWRDVVLRSGSRCASIE